jgi:hypothetical protein
MKPDMFSALPLQKHTIGNLGHFLGMEGISTGKSVTISLWP